MLMKKAMSAALFATLFLTGVVAPPVRAADDQPRAANGPSKAYVVLVGISDYADKQIKPRKHGETDAKALYDLFTSKDYLDTTPDHVKLLLGVKDEKRPCELATRDNILKALHWAASQAGKDDLVIFAFIGQGGPMGDRVCFFSSDSTFKGRDKTAVAAADIEKAMEGMKSQQFCAFIDVTFNGFDPGMESVAEPNPNDLVKIFLNTKEEKEDHQLPVGKVVFLATNGLKPSLDLEKQGLFTQALLDGLKGAADKEGYESDGVVTVDELVKFLEKQVG